MGKSRRTQYKLGLLLVAAMLIVAVYARTRPLADFLVFWTGSHLFVAHQNPYSLPLSYQLERTQGYNQATPVMMLSPPWAFTLFTPLGYAHSYVLAWIVSFVILTVALAISSRILMDLYFGSLDIQELSYPRSYRYLFAFTFYPALLALKMTQIGSLLLLGVAGFLYFEKRKSPWLAGVALSLTMLKPHLVLLLYLVLLLRRQWRELVSAAGVVLALMAFAVYWDRSILGEYWELMSGPYPKIVVSGILAGMRSALPSHNTYYLQFVPPLVGVIWLTSYWTKHRSQWSWAGKTPILILASVIAAPYGFVQDQTLLLITITALAAINAARHGKISLSAIMLYTAVNAITLVLAMLQSPWCIVPAPLTLAAVLYFKPQTEDAIPGLAAFAPQ